MIYYTFISELNIEHKYVSELYNAYIKLYLEKII